MKHSQVLGMALVALSIGGARVVQAQGDHGRQHDQHDQHDDHGRVSPQEQQQRIQQEQQRNAQYQQQLGLQNQLLRQRDAQLQQANRNAEYRAQQAYEQRLLQQQAQLRAERDYARDPYINAPRSYRYNMGGAYHETNQYGVNVLQQAVNYGYQEGVRAGQADRQDRWRSDYQASPAYQDANYGYTGAYVDRADYNYYFRQGFRRGYQDGYSSRYQYGTYSNGTGSILGNVITSILGLQPIR